MSAASETILWHDYETTGIDTRRDRPMVFAAQRTDTELRPLGEPIVVQFALADDAMPSPEACLVTGLDPDRPGGEGELVGARRILACMTQPSTCTAGFNSIRFDDEITRFMLWRNLLPVFDRESRNGNSRFDLIDLLRAACALRPDGMEWPTGEEGWPTFRLEALAAANGIAHAAHDALSDVQATIDVARRLASAQPGLFDYLSQSRSKRKVLDRLRGFGSQPFVHVSRRFPAAIHCTSLVMRVTDHPRFANQVLCIDLRHDPQPILDLGADELRSLLFMPREQRPDDAPRIGVKGIHLNRCPVIAPRDVLDEASLERIELDLAICDRHAELVAAHARDFSQKLAALFDEESTPAADVDQALYDGFVDGEDARLRDEVHVTPPSGWRALERAFQDPRLGELLFRMRARNHPETLGLTEVERWRSVCRDKLAGAEDALQRIAELRDQAGVDLAVLDACERAIETRLRKADPASAP